MKDPLNEGRKKTVWYENYDPVNGYLNNEKVRKAENHENEPSDQRLSWKDIFK
ncbi:MAG: hypothetical protein PVG17_15775 [Desulfobacterales bacterium]|jgi:hypothetical protein